MRILLFFVSMYVLVTLGRPHFDLPELTEFCIFEHANCTGEVIFKETTRVAKCSTLSNLGCHNGHVYNCALDFDGPLDMENHVTTRISRYPDQCIVGDRSHGWIDSSVGFKKGCFPMSPGATPNHGSMRMTCQSGLQKIEYFASEDCTDRIIASRNLGFESVFGECKPSGNGKWHVVHCSSLIEKK